MNPIMPVYTKLLWQPLLNALVFFYNVLPGNDLGLAIIALTIVVRTAVAPLFWKSQQAQASLSRIQPEVKKIQTTLQHDREAQGKALMKLYSDHNVNPFSGCLLALVQIPVLIALFGVFRTGLDPANLSYLYSFVASPGVLNPISFGVLDLSKGSIYLGIIAAIAQYVQTKMTMPAPSASPDPKDFSHILQTQALYVFPAIILVSSFSFPAALMLYWTSLSLFGIVQEIVMKRFKQEQGAGRGVAPSSHYS